jgi:hypothetical protein
VEAFNKSSAGVPRRVQRNLDVSGIFRHQFRKTSHIWKKGGAAVIHNNQPKIEPKEWRYDLLKEKDPNYLINEAPLDGLLAVFHSGSKGSTLKGIQIEFLKMLLSGRYTEASVESMERLTESLNKASKSSTIVGVGLIIVGVASAFAAALTYLK